VVEGYINVDHKISITVTKEIPFNSDDTVAQPIEALEILLTNNDNSELLSDLGSGVYESNSIIARTDEKYSIEFEYNGKSVSSETTIPTKPIDYHTSANSITITSFTPGSGAPPSFPEPIQLTWDNPDNRYFLVVVENIENNPTPIYDTSRFDPKMFFRNEPLQTNLYELNMRSFGYYGTHRVILYNLNPEYAALYEDNGSSSLNLSTPISNINGGLGIFTGINSDTLYLEVKKY